MITGIVSMKRVDLKKKILESSEAIVYLMKLEDLKEYIESFYYCRYRQFFLTLLKIAEQIKNDRYLKLHQKYLIRETRVVVYSQFL